MQMGQQLHWIKELYFGLIGKLLARCDIELDLPQLTEGFDSLSNLCEPFISNSLAKGETKSQIIEHMVRFLKVGGERIQEWIIDGMAGIIQEEVEGLKRLDIGDKVVETLSVIADTLS